MRSLPALVAPLLVLGAACLPEPATRCADGRICPDQTVCHPLGCVPAEQAAACAGRADGDTCSAGLITDGVCTLGACVDAGCGNQLVEPARGERCDDGNQVGGDGCSADCTSTQECGNALIDREQDEQCDDGNPVSGDGCSSACQDEQPRWVQGVPVVQGRRWAHAGYDAAAGEVLVFGGGDGGQLFGDTWRWDGTAWWRATPPVSPSAREGGAIAYDARRRRMVLFGGDSSARLGDTWEWDGATWQRRLVTTQPPARTHAGMTYDAVRGEILMFGGIDRMSKALADTWAWDGETWIDRTSAVAPPPRFWAQLAFDPVRGRAVLHGGLEQFDATAVLTDTWEWDGTAWSLVEAAAPQGGRYFGSMTFVPARGRVVLVGGATQRNPDVYRESSDEWDGVTWRPLSAAPGTGAHTTVWDEARQQLVLLGGWYTGAGMRTDAASVPGLMHGLWSTLATIRPLPRALHAAAYDPARGAAFVLGGTPPWDDVWDDVWIHDPTGWRSGPVPPRPRQLASAVFDPERGAVLLFGGVSGSSNLDDTWLVDDTRWREVPLATRPPARSRAGLVWDSQRRRALMFGGRRVPSAWLIEPTDPPRPASEFSADTWAWDGAGWTDLAPAEAPLPRWGAGMAYDPVRDRVVLFAGQSADQYALDDTWEFDGTTWQQLQPTQVPPRRVFPAMTFDPRRGRVVLFGGLNAGGPLDDTWEWTGTDWELIEVSGQVPLGRWGTTLVPGRDGAPRLFGGVTGDLEYTYEEHWRLEWSSGGRAERCTTGDDADGDGLAGCADPDCWPSCDPLCPPRTSCPATRPRCGDATCDPLETCASCEVDCGACP
ncbi:MAG: hypothetical protein KA297_16435 [Kofleriaceae bacterium]|nr:hypothetical protein [Kofleriaceae bacterium]MBP6837292.1 hypothetical protein [Kofleriaceae bacterium]